MEAFLQREHFLGIGKVEIWSPVDAAPKSLTLVVRVSALRRFRLRTARKKGQARKKGHP